MDAVQKPKGLAEKFIANNLNPVSKVDISQLEGEVYAAVDAIAAHHDGFDEGVRFQREQQDRRLTVFLERLTVSTGEQERAEALRKFIQWT